jgi:hypothetical protein
LQSPHPLDTCGIIRIVTVNANNRTGAPGMSLHRIIAFILAVTLILATLTPSQARAGSSIGEQMMLSGIVTGAVAVVMLTAIMLGQNREPDGFDLAPGSTVNARADRPERLRVGAGCPIQAGTAPSLICW